MSWLLSPLAWLLLACVPLPWAWRRRKRGVLAACGVVAFISLGAMTALGANLLAAPLERPYLHSDGCAAAPPSTAIVLGGGLDGWPRDGSDYSVLNLSSRRRVDRAVAWWRERPGRTLLMQGGAPYPNSPSLAELMASYARMQGVPDEALRMETGSGDTWENALHAAALAPAVPRRAVLVTSYVHMRRAKQAYERHGFEVCPLGTDRRRLPSRIPWALIPRTRALANTEIALHEWIGLVYYRWRSDEAVSRR